MEVCTRSSFALAARGSRSSAVNRRISTPEALAWSDGTRAMFGGFYAQYAFGQLSDRCFAVWPRRRVP